MCTVPEFWHVLDDLPEFWHMLDDLHPSLRVRDLTCISKRSHTYPTNFILFFSSVTVNPPKANGLHRRKMLYFAGSISSHKSETMTRNVTVTISAVFLWMGKKNTQISPLTFVNSLIKQKSKQIWCISLLGCSRLWIEIAHLLSGSCTLPGSIGRQLWFSSIS